MVGHAQRADRAEEDRVAAASCSRPSSGIMRPVFAKRSQLQSNSVQASTGHISDGMPAPPLELADRVLPSAQMADVLAATRIV